MTLLSVVKAAQRELSTLVASAVVGASDEITQQMFALANREGRELAQRHNWQVLMTERVITTVATEEQPGALPADFLRLVPGTLYERTLTRAIDGPYTAHEWARFHSSAAGPTWQVFRIRGNSLLLLPVPAAGATVAFEYVTRNWVDRGGGDYAPEYSSDGDTARLDEELIKLGVIWRWLERRGLDYQAQFQIYQGMVQKAIQDDGGRPNAISVIPSPYDADPSIGIPDGSWDL